MKVEKKIPTHWPPIPSLSPEYIITLSSEEAQYLITILGCLCPNNSNPEKFVAELYNRLCNIGLKSLKMFKTFKLDLLP